MKIEAAGVSYYVAHIEAVAKRGRLYDRSDTDILNAIPEGRRTYEYYFGDVEISLTPEPDNPVDKNAIAVKADGLTVGYIPADLTASVRRLMDNKKTISGRITGGNFKKVSGGTVFSGNYGYNVEIEIEGDDEMICPKCGGDNVSIQVLNEVTLKNAHHSLLWWLFVGWWWIPCKWFFFTVPALLAAIFVPKRKKAINMQRKVCVCNSCGNSWDIS